MKRCLFLLFALLATLLVFSGCQRDDSPRLVYWSMWNEAEPQGQAIAQAAAAFTRETGIRMDINFNGREIRMTLQPALDGGVVIDIFDEDIDRVNSAWAGYLLNLDPYITGVYPTTAGRPYNQVVSQSLMAIARDAGGGSVRTIPYQPFVFTMMYNKDIFNRVGITRMPATWAEFIDVCERIAAAGFAPITVDDAYAACFVGYVFDRVVGTEATLNMVRTKDFSHPGVLRAAQVLEQVAGYFHPNAAGNVWPAGQVNEFAGGRAAMYLNGTWLPNEIRGQVPDFNWGSFAFPAIDPAGRGIESNNVGSQSFGINRNTRFPDEAFQFLVWMTTGRWDEELARMSLGIPMGVDSLWPPQLAEAKAVVDNTTNRLPWAVGFQDDADINATVTANFQRLVAGTINAAQFADALRRL